MDEDVQKCKKPKVDNYDFFPIFTLPNTILLPIIKERDVSPQFNKVLMNRVYVGNLSPDVRKQDLKPVFEEFGVIRSINLGINPSTRKCKGFGFVELDNPHGAALAIKTLDSVHLYGKVIKVNRPVNYPKELPKDLLRVDHTLVYVSNIHSNVSERDLEKIMGCIGECRVYLMYGDGYSHAGYGFVKFAHHSMARDALKIDAKIGGKKLMIGPTVIAQELPMKKKSVDPKIQEIALEIENEIFETELENNCLILKNLIELNELDSEFVCEIENEMQKYGTIVKLEVVINKDFYYEIKNVTVDKEQKEEVVVYVIYEKPSDLHGAAKIMKNRYFGGRRIRVETCRR
ncbi:Poly(U)-binding-splicing factor half pint [Dictyocoela roeselum]|nr:Poly(U)-binding-splicing factor half pint [Dictyocoela roeselum]